MYNMHSNAGGVEVEAGPCGEWKSEWAATIYINPVSDKYQLAQMRMLYNDDECWIVPMFADGSKTQLVTNKGAAYSDLTDVTFRKSPSGEKCETISSSPFAMNWGMGTAGIAPSSMWGVQSSLASFHHVRYCPTASSELHPEYGCLMTFGGEDSAEIIDKYVDYDDEGNIIHEEVIYSTKNIVSPYFSLGMERNTGLPYIDNRFLSTKTGGIDMDNSLQMPVSYCVSSETMPVFGSSPQFLRFFYLTYDSQWYDYPYPLFAYDSCGFYGESRSDGDISIELNGKRIVSSPQELAEWQMKCMESAMEFGKLVFNYRNDNIEIDGLPGVNTAEISIDTSLDDYTAPLIQSVQFRDSNDRVIERFTQPSDGRLIVTGGDFQENYGSGLNVFGETPLWYEVEDCGITVEYSPYGESDYQPLEVIRENEPMSGFGFPYVASLDCVDRNSVSGWFDIRITMSDASGNSHQQVISPAFHMDSLTGVQSVSLNKSNLHVSDGMVVSDDGADVEVSTISGRRVANSNLSPGIYIARGGESVAKLIVR